MYLIGYDIGSSSIKAALIDQQTQKQIALEKYPNLEMDIISRQASWAEQHPEIWWDNLCLATKALIQKNNIDANEIKSIGISYQMHGLVIVDKEQNVIRPSIIWCDSRAVQIGNQAFNNIGEDYCMSHYLNSPGNFTASKLKWVKDHEPERYEKIHKFMLPGDYIAMKLSGKINTTINGLSEGILWDFKEDQIAQSLLDYYGISSELIPEIVGAFDIQSELSLEASQATGLKPGTLISYRAGDQPNNALSLGVFKPGQVAATGGTSGVVYGLVDQLAIDSKSRINSFAHPNHTSSNPSIGMLLCINGAGIQYAWMKKQIARDGVDYHDMERMISSIPIGSDGLRIIPFGNGAERMLNNSNPGAQINNLQFNRHTRAHFYRAALEGIAFSFVYGCKILNNIGLSMSTIKVGNDNLFQSRIFSRTIANLLNTPIEIVETTGAIGAAKASGLGTGAYKSMEECFTNNNVIGQISPDDTNKTYNYAYELWYSDLGKLLTN